MKNGIITSLLFAMLFAANLNATVWRVNNKDNTADFNDIKAAHDNEQVLAGDTLLVEGSQNYYSSFDCSKKLTIIGPGYFLSSNYKSADVLPAKLDYIRFSEGSEGSSLIGLTFNYDSRSAVTIFVDNINIERCYARSYIYLHRVENIRIINCYVKGVNDFDDNDGWNSPISKFNNVYVNNNIMTESVEVNDLCHFLSYQNNILLGTSYTFNAYHFRNNIVISGDATMNINSAYIENNIGTNNVFGEGNLNVTDINALFVGGESPDAKYQLATSSEAIGAGYEGGDCGIFGGDDPYVISGLPPLPIITELDVDDAASVETGLNVKIKVRSN